MNTYKITNITNLSNKREFKHNSSLDITYVDNLKTNKVTIKAGETIFLRVNSLPMSVRKLRVENLVTVTEVGDIELEEVIDSKRKPKLVTKPTSRVESIEVEAQSQPRKRTNTKKN